MSQPESKRVILIVDDSEDDRFFFELVFKKSGIQGRLFSANNGEEAVEYLTHSGRFSDPAEFPLPDFMFLDLKMPGRNGFEVLEWVGGRPAETKFPIIVLSGSYEPSDIRRARDLGAAHYIVKPITQEALQRILSA